MRRARAGSATARLGASRCTQRRGPPVRTCCTSPACVVLQYVFPPPPPLYCMLEKGILYLYSYVYRIYCLPFSCALDCTYCLILCTLKSDGRVCASEANQKCILAPFLLRWCFIMHSVRLLKLELFGFVSRNYTTVFVVSKIHIIIFLIFLLTYN